MFRTTFVVLVTMACTQARPQGTLPALPTFQFPSPQSFGQSNSGITKGETITPGGQSTVVQSEANTGGQVSNGGTNFGTASTGEQSLSTPFGTSSSSKTGAQSIQGPGGFPSIPSFPSFGFGGTASGNAAGQSTFGKTTGPGGITTITSSGSSAGGKTTGSGTSNSSATTSNTSVDTPHGSQTTSNIDTHSTQTGR